MNHTPASIYQMHKYWGKKPGKEISKIIKTYSDEKDLLLDPFSGYGGLAIEGILQNRNVIINDLNPIACFISECILNPDINIPSLQNLFERLKSEYDLFEKNWYTFDGQEIVSVLRNHQNKPLKLKLKSCNSVTEIVLTDEQSRDFEKQENDYAIKTWYPNKRLITNSRIGIKSDMSIADLFPKRALICHSYLFDLISKLDDCPEKKLLLLAFTANLANCSKLVPPIKSRGDMSQGAWMTGFYIAKQYLENNVFHYFENRVNKIINGKEAFIRLTGSSEALGTYKILNEDAKKLSVADNSIDFVFTDFPYGDAVPYFEQSQLWNAWLNFEPDFYNEIVISDSNERVKDFKNFETDIEIAISEIARVLKDGHYFVFTFHSLYGKEWIAITRALSNNHFKFVDYQVLSQKTVAPRQLNRTKTIKGDLIVIYKKDNYYKIDTTVNNSIVFLEKILFNECTPDKLYDTNELIIICIKALLSYNIADNEIDFFEIIEKIFYEVDNKWIIKNQNIMNF